MGGNPPTSADAVNSIVFFGADAIYALTASAPQQPPAQGPTGSERNGGGNLSEHGYCLRCIGDPIDGYSGNFTHTFDDLSIPGRGLALAFSHTYNAGAASIGGPLGYGWTGSYYWSLSFDGSGNATILQENGSTVTFAPNGSGGYTAPSRVLAAFVQNGDGSYTFTRLRDQTHYTFSGSTHQLVKETDRNGYATTLAYNGSGQLATVTNPAGRTLSFTYDTNSHLTQVTDPAGRTVSFAYDGSGNLASFTDVNGGVTHFTYDSNHLLLTMTDPLGHKTTNGYDGSGRVTSQTDPMNRTTSFSYASGSGGMTTTTITDPKGNVTVEQYYNGLLMSETKGYGTSQAATWSYTYDPLSLGVASITDPNGNITSQTWDQSGNLLTKTDPLGDTTSYTYNSLNEVLTDTDPLGVTTTNTYDTSGNLLSTSTPLVGTSQSQTTTYTYGDSAHPGDVTAMTDPDGKASTYTYDTYGDRLTSTDPLGDTTTDTYNVLGEKTTEKTPLGHTTTYTYNAFGDVLTTKDALGDTATNQYDADRNLTAQTDANGNLTQYTYDADNEMTKTTRADTTTVQTGYDADGNQTSQTDGNGKTTSYAYDPLNRLISLTDPLSRTTTYAYDPAGNRVSLTSPDALVTSYTYDAANQLVGIAYSDGVTHAVSYTYDADGQRLTMTDGTGTTTSTYDSLHRLISQTNGAGQTVSYVYDLKGQLTVLTYPTGKTVTRTYDAAGRLVAVADWLGHTSRFGYDADGNLISAALANDVQGHFTYDQADRLLALVYRSTGPVLGAPPQVLLALSYARDPLGLLQSGASKYQPQNNATYSYTALNQVQAVAASTTTNYVYDAAGDPTQLGVATLTYDAANELTALTQGSATTNYTDNKRGDRTQAATGSATVSLSYDEENRLTTYATATTSATYAYNGDGLRMSKTVNGGAAEAYTWDTAEGLPLLLQDGTTDFVYGPNGALLEQIAGNGTTFFALQDQLGSTRLLTDAHGNIAATYTYDAYGNTLAHTGTASTLLRFAGQYADAESGLYYLRARYYDPATAQLLTRDPLVPLTKAPYAYAGDDPLNASDPSGQFLGLENFGTWFHQHSNEIALGARVVEDVASVVAAACILTADPVCAGTAGAIGLLAGGVRWAAESSARNDGALNTGLNAAPLGVDVSTSWLQSVLEGAPGSAKALLYLKGWGVIGGALGLYDLYSLFTSSWTPNGSLRCDY